MEGVCASHHLIRVWEPFGCEEMRLLRNTDLFDSLPPSRLQEAKTNEALFIETNQACRRSKQAYSKKFGDVS
jgi:hypothetical protein